jgi:hypothetical protein
MSKRRTERDAEMFFLGAWTEQTINRIRQQTQGGHPRSDAVSVAATTFGSFLVTCRDACCISELRELRDAWEAREAQLP